ncbi:hypothetical protein ES332_D05G167300v1 [Gossypium tomentosum]|uniref:Uncharacterized protein n=1 Tax=Gossypium tomentosum TaxID=34277 RepID=A0A5D2KWL0_GOSTO|nr:hypothetical protein ES332_D05G167300v1 [Gossypium tomentosum]
MDSFTFIVNTTDHIGLPLWSHCLLTFVSFFSCLIVSRQNKLEISPSHLGLWLPEWWGRDSRPPCGLSTFFSLGAQPLLSSRESPRPFFYSSGKVLVVGVSLLISLDGLCMMISI